MVPYFPPPHSDELWYSVLCRSYVYSGITTASRFIDVCFRTTQYSILNPFNINRSIYLYCQQNPNYPYSPQTIVEYHTLFPFYSRFLSRQKKTALLKAVCEGTANIRPPHCSNIATTQKLKYCPECVIKDRETYGEAYWHTTHQIPTATCCLLHKCRLHTLPDKITSYGLYPLEHQQINFSRDYDIPEWEIDLNNILWAYHSLPIETSPTTGYNALIDALTAQMYIDKITCPKKEALKDKLTNAVGMDLVKKLYGSNLKGFKFNEIKSWEENAGQRYAPLQLATGVDITSPFSLVNQPEKGLIKARLLGLAIGKTNITKNEVSREVGLSPWKLTIFALENELPIFWKENLYGQEIIKEYHDAKQKESC